MKPFALIGAAGYIAPRHMKAIRDTGNDLIAALDPKDSVGILDSYFPDAHFFTEFERFDRHVDKQRRKGEPVRYVSICSPNYLHDAHIRFALRVGADAICEKPLVLNPWNVDALADIERESGRRIYSVLQLRHHAAIQALRAKVAASPKDKIHDIDLTYLTSRGRWYQASWKGRIEKSGGIATNIGVHFFDMLEWVFGPRQSSIMHLHEPDAAAGYLEFAKARVRWFLSINATHLPAEILAAGKRTFRSITIDGEELEFSEGFTDLHTVTYENILDGQGFGLEDARPSIETVFDIRTAPPRGMVGDYHPFCAAAFSSRSALNAAQEHA
ncbi:Gfo/Idh/MocA family protein [Azospirillum agricola]|uniref:Gfo/Idh/MocA family protein n=1 Tax=Azospirillum agricola TaxID=1720247 RepID=UPI000A0F2BF8|nr:Gfo/Idh/MocA family oxidoreductase [Azospirillum agricola]SMH41586.1 UDP-N-acetyl-2-amino-2-deoxyglucuronate dehydrogenase [Azospirillum lipoferum]